MPSVCSTHQKRNRNERLQNGRFIDREICNVPLPRNHKNRIHPAINLHPEPQIGSGSATVTI
jgi:hypothetical protein